MSGRGYVVRVLSGAAIILGIALIARSGTWVPIFGGFLVLSGLDFLIAQEFRDRPCRCGVRR